MTWAEYLAWWHDPVNLYHVFVSGALYVIGINVGVRRERRRNVKSTLALMAKWQRIGKLIATGQKPPLRSPPESEK